MNPYDIIEKYYNPCDDLYKILVEHSEKVKDKAMTLASKHPELNIDMDFLSEGAMLHDIGIFMTDAPGIQCFGTHRYIEHGYLGADIMRKEGYERHALVCERHTGTGLSIDYILRNDLPLPVRNYMPESIEEQLIWYADKFFSKNHLDKEFTSAEIEKKLMKWGYDGVLRFKHWRDIFE